MILISHRGNINGKIEYYENKPTYIDLAISQGYDVEVDVWYVNNKLYLGHDSPQYEIEYNWFVSRINNLWIHCKNIDAISLFKNNGYMFNFFWHETDTITLTSNNFIWAYPGKQPIIGSIAVMPEINTDNTSVCIGICSDYIQKYKNENNL